MQADVGASDPPLACSLDDLNVVHSNYSLPVDVDELFVQNVARKKHFAFASHEGTKVKDIRVQTHALLIQIGYMPAPHKEVATTISCYYAYYRWVIVGSESNDNVLNGSHTFPFKIAYWAT